MRNILKFATLFLLISACSNDVKNSKVDNSLQNAIDSLLKTKNAKVGVAIIGPEAADTFHFLGNEQFSIMSVIKFPQAIGIMSLVESGKLNLEQTLEFDSMELKRYTWSPFANLHPHGNASLKLNETFGFSVAQSDNIVCDKLFELLSPSDLEKWMHDKSYTNMHFGTNYKRMNPDSIWLNNSTPMDMARLLYDFKSGNLLKNESRDFILTFMKNTSTGPKRLKGLLPADVVVAHKTGTYFDNDTFIKAINDVGIVELPGGKFYAIAVFVNDSKEGEEKSEKIIAEINSLAYKHFMNRKLD